MRILTLILLLAFAGSVRAATATSVTVRNVTWNFSASRTVGQYANGDWWVVGPVTITSTVPPSENDGGWVKHGMMVNPAPGFSGQGFDSSMSGLSTAPSYNGANNLDPGIAGSLTLSEGTLVKSISRSTAAVAGRRPQLQGMEYLTVVSDEPAANSFRPPPTGTDKSSPWTTNDLDYSILRNLTVLSGAPSKAGAEAWFLRPWPSFILDNQGRWVHPIDNMPEYGRDFGRRLGQGGLVLHSDVGDKSTLFIRMVQIGIDTHATIEGDRFFTGFGGINCGWKWPALLAGLALGDTNIQYSVSGGITTSGSAPNASRLNFSFDRQTWYVLQSDVGRVMYSADGRPRLTYEQAHVGLPEWGEQHWKQQNRDGSNWNAYYRQIAFAGEFSGILAAVLTVGGSAAWGWPATIDYFDRYMAFYPSPFGGSNPLSAWEGAMYDAYRMSADPAPDPAPEPPAGPTLAPRVRPLPSGMGLGLP
jgi:hypothetical protein